MRYLCMYCACSLADDDPDSPEVSHGLCPDCYPKFVAGTGKPAQEFLDTLPYPVFVVNADRLLVGANQHARRMAVLEFDEQSPALGGEAFQCVHAVKPGGCGKTVHCKTCTVRNTVIDTGLTGKPHDDVPAYMDLGDVTGSMHMKYTISTQKAGEVVLLKIMHAEQVEVSSSTCEAVSAVLAPESDGE